MYRLAVRLLFVFAAMPLAAAPVVTGVSWPESREQRQIRLGDPVWVRVSELATLRAMEGRLNAPITLWLDGRDTRLAAQGFNEASGWIRFRLDRTPENRELWSDLLYDPFSDPTREVNVSVGVGSAIAAADGTSTRLTLLKIVPSHALLWLSLLAALIIFFIWLARTTDIVRNGPPIDGRRQAYSLGRVQMAWWFILILAGFVAIALISGDEASITPSLLALMGISAATALGSAAIDAQPTARAADATSQNWFFDIIQDDSGTVALHRLQIVIWTIVLGAMFVVTVCRKLTMPEFSGTLLALMGISGGTYIGFKIPGATRNGG